MPNTLSLDRQLDIGRAVMATTLSGKSERGVITDSWPDHRMGLVYRVQMLDGMILPYPADQVQDAGDVA